MQSETESTAFIAFLESREHFRAFDHLHGALHLFYDDTEKRCRSIPWTCQSIMRGIVQILELRPIKNTKYSQSNF